MPLAVFKFGHCAEAESHIRPAPCIVPGTGEAARCKCMPKKVFSTGTKEPTVREELPWLALLACATAVMVWLPMSGGAV